MKAVCAYFFEHISPSANAHPIHCRLLIIEGARLARIPIRESEQMERVLRQKVILVWMVIAENKEYGLRRKSNRDYTAWVEPMFLERNLPGWK